MRTFYGYIRVSTTRQGEQGVSLDQQRSAIQTYAETHGLDLVQWFEEQETAARRGRPVFGKMLKLLKAGRAAGVVIHKIDRSARNLRDWADLGELIDDGIAVHFANEALDLNSRGGRLAADIQAIISADFIRNLREETKKGFYGRLKQGLLPRPAPVGYLNCGKGKPKAVDPEKAHLVREAFELYASGRFNVRDLADEMYHLGLRGRNGKRISVNGLYKILHNRFYTGIIAIAKTGEIYPGIHEPIVTPALFDRVQAILKSKDNRKTARHAFVFRRLFRCKNCGFHLIGEENKGFIYYRCHTRDCPTRYIRESVLNQAVIKELKKLEFAQEEKDYFRGRVSEIRKNWANRQQETVQSLSLQLKQLEDRLAKLTDAFLDQLIDKQTFENRKTTLLSERRLLGDKLDDCRKNPVLAADRLASFLERAGNAYVTYQCATDQERRELINNLTSGRSVNGKSVEVMLDLPFNMLANRFLVPAGSPPRTTPLVWNDVINKILTLLPLKTPDVVAEHVM